MVSSALPSRPLRYQELTATTASGSAVLEGVSFSLISVSGSVRRDLGYHQQRGWQLHTQGQGMLGRRSSLYLRFSRPGLQYPYSLSNPGFLFFLFSSSVTCCCINGCIATSLAPVYMMTGMIRMIFGVAGRKSMVLLGRRVSGSGVTFVCLLVLFCLAGNT